MAGDGRVFDITVIGGGPVGLFGAFYAGMRGLSTLIVDSLPELGGQLATLYPEKYIYDMPGFPKVLARDLAQAMTEQAMQFGPTVRLNETEKELHPHGEGVWELRTSRGAHLTRTLLIAAGAGAFQPKKLNAPGVDRFEGHGVHYFVRNLEAFADRQVLVIGGGDSAVDWCLSLAGVARDVTLIHRRDTFRAHEESVRQLHESSVAVRTFHELARVGGEAQVESAVIYDSRDGTETVLVVDTVLISIGFVASLGPIKAWGLDLRGNSIVVDAEMQTNLPGVFAAGDVVTYPGKIKLIATGVGEAAVAVNHAKQYLDPGARLFPGHSSDRKT